MDYIKRLILYGTLVHPGNLSEKPGPSHEFNTLFTGFLITSLLRDTGIGFALWSGTSPTMGTIGFGLVATASWFFVMIMVLPHCAMLAFLAVSTLADLVVLLGLRGEPNLYSHVALTAYVLGVSIVYAYRWGHYQRKRAPKNTDHE